MNSRGAVVGFEDGDSRTDKPSYGFAITPGTAGFDELSHAGRAFIPQAFGTAYRANPGDLPQARAFSWDPGTGVFRDLGPPQCLRRGVRDR